MENIVRKAYAKTNLFLRVIGSRPDGFTEIETLFHPVRSVCDTLRVDFNGSCGITLECSAAGVPCDPSNLCWKAASAYLRAAGLSETEEKIRISLEKGIPTAAGMGGGSSDAAAMLLIMQEKYHLLKEEELHGIAAGLGSDVPLFLDLKDTVGTGRGEILEPVPVHRETELPLLFAAPGFPVSAKWAYRHADPALCHGAALSDTVRALAKGDIPALRKGLRNDLQHAVFRKFPLLEMIREKLQESGGAVLLSGSGPTVFALYDSMEAREEACHKDLSFFQERGIRFFKG